MIVNALAPKQLQSVRESTGKVNIWSGAIRSGKTIASLLRWAIFVATAPPSGELVIIGRTRDSAWRNVVAPLQDPSLFDTVADAVEGNYGASTCTIMGRRCFILGASDAKAEKVIRGLTVAGAYVDEVTTVPEEFFVQLLGRMSVRGAQLFGTTNPDNPSHWFKREHLDKMGDRPDWRHWHFLMEDNVSLDPEYVAAQKRQFTGLWYRRFILGEWVAGEGAVFSMWDPDTHTTSQLPDTYERVLAIGADHGMQAPSAAIAVGLAHGRLWAFDEWWMEASTQGRAPTVADQSLSLRTWASGLPAPRFVPVDPAALAFRTQLHRDGMDRVTSADNDVTYGVTRLGALLSSNRLVISKKCENLIREIPGYSWDEKAAERGEDKPIKTADHAIDALRYAVISTEPMWHRAAPIDQPLPAAA